MGRPLLWEELDHTWQEYTRGTSIQYSVVVYLATPYGMAVNRQDSGRFEEKDCLNS